MSAPTLLLLAAGMGSRYGGPKQLDTLGPGGMTLMDYAAFDAARAGFGRLVVVTRKALRPAVEAGPAARAARVLDVTIVEQELDRIPAWGKVPPGREAPWGTAHAVLVARESVPGAFAVVNADDFYGADTLRLLGEAARTADAAGAAGLWTNVAFPLGSTMSEHGGVNRAVCEVDAQGWLTRVSEQRGIVRTPSGDGVVDGRTLPASTLVSMNSWVFTQQLFDLLDAHFTAFLRSGPGLKDEALLPDVVNNALASGIARGRVAATTSVWCGVTHAADRPATVATLQRLHDAGAYPSPLWA